MHCSSQFSYSSDVREAEERVLVKKMLWCLLSEFEDGLVAKQAVDPAAATGRLGETPCDVG